MLLSTYLSIYASIYLFIMNLTQHAPPKGFSSQEAENTLHIMLVSPIHKLLMGSPLAEELQTMATRLNLANLESCLP